MVIQKYVQLLLSLKHRHGKRFGGRSMPDTLYTSTYCCVLGVKMLKGFVLLFIFVFSNLFFEYGYSNASSYFLESKTNLTVTKLKGFRTQQLIISLHKRLLPDSSLYNTKPWITDIFAVPQKNATKIYAVFNALNQPLKDMNVNYNNFTLYYHEYTLHDITPIEIHAEAIRVMKFILPAIVSDPFFYVTIIDSVRKNTYEDLPVEVLSNVKLGGFGACAMLSDFNSPYEMKNWVAWNKYQNLTNVMIYSIKPVPEAEAAIKQGLSSGFIRYYQYQYPLNKYRRVEQRSIQLAVLNSCYYRHRHQYDGLVMIDLDEFVYSPMNPTSFPVTLKYLLKRKKGDYFNIYSTLYYLRPGVTRDESFKNGNTFSDHVWKEPPRFSGRVKYMIKPSSESCLSTHWCIGCKKVSPIQEATLMLLHFKAGYKNKTKLTFDDSMKVYTPFLQKAINDIFGSL